MDAGTHIEKSLCFASRLTRHRVRVRERERERDREREREMQEFGQYSTILQGSTSDAPKSYSEQAPTLRIATNMPRSGWMLLGLTVGAFVRLSGPLSRRRPGQQSLF